MFVIVMVATGVAVLLLDASTGRADHRPYVRPDSTVVYGDWGLYRAGHVPPWIEGPTVVEAARYGGPGYFFPTNRDDPGAHRRRPPEKSGPPPEPYYRWWGAESEPPQSSRPTEYAPFAPPAVIYAPRDAYKHK
jgi:hypothetical protein